MNTRHKSPTGLSQAVQVQNVHVPRRWSHARLLLKGAKIPSAECVRKGARAVSAALRVALFFHGQPNCFGSESVPAVRGGEARRRHGGKTAGLAGSWCISPVGIEKGRPTLPKRALLDVQSVHSSAPNVCVLHAVPIVCGGKKEQFRFGPEARKLCSYRTKKPNRRDSLCSRQHAVR